MLCRLLGRDFRLQLCREPGLLFCGQPVGLFRPVGQIEPGDDTEQHRGDAFDDEQPLPSPQAHHAVKPEQQAGDRRADHGGNGNGDGERGEKPPAIFRRIPIGQIKNDAGEEAGFGHAQQEAQHVKAQLAAHRRHRGGDNAPGHHDAGDPAAGAEFLQREVARHLEDEIADEEDAGAPGEDQRRELQVRVHGQRGEAEIDAVEIGKEIGQHQKRDQPPRDRADGGSFDVTFGWRGGLVHGFPPSGFLLPTTISGGRHRLQCKMPALGSTRHSAGEGLRSGGAAMSARRLAADETYSAS